MDLVVPGIRRRYLESRVLRTKIAYPVFLKEYEEARKRLEEGTGMRGLYSIGRNGEFAHILTEDVHWPTLRKTHRAFCELGACHRSMSRWLPPAIRPPSGS